LTSGGRRQKIGKGGLLGLIGGQVLGLDRWGGEKILAQARGLQCGKYAIDKRDEPLGGGRVGGTTRSTLVGGCGEGSGRGEAMFV